MINYKLKLKEEVLMVKVKKEKIKLIALRNIKIPGNHIKEKEKFEVDDERISKAMIFMNLAKLQTKRKINKVKKETNNSNNEDSV